MTLNNFVSFLNAKLTKKSMLISQGQTKSSLEDMQSLNVKKLVTKSASELKPLKSTENNEKKFVNKLLNNAQCSLGQNCLTGILLFIRILTRRFAGSNIFYCDFDYTEFLSRA